MHEAQEELLRYVSHIQWDWGGEWNLTKMEFQKAFRFRAQSLRDNKVNEKMFYTYHSSKNQPQEERGQTWPILCTDGLKTTWSKNWK